MTIAECSQSSPQSLRCSAGARRCDVSHRRAEDTLLPLMSDADAAQEDERVRASVSER